MDFEPVGDVGKVMKRLCKILVLLVGCITCTLWSSAQDIANPKPLIDFKEQNFGVRFSHTTNVSTAYNPHGGADRVLLSYLNKSLGGLLIRPAPTCDIKEFIKAGKAYYKKEFGAKNVEYNEYSNSEKCKFHRLKAEIKRNGDDSVLVRYVYLREDSKKPADFADKLMLSLSGAFSFEFVYLKKDKKELEPEIMTIIDTFRLGDISDVGIERQTSPTK